MTMFQEQLRHNEDDALCTQLVTLYDAYCEFHCYCAFLHQAHAGIVARDLEIEQDTRDGISMSGRCLTLRSQQIKEHIRKTFELAKKEAKEKEEKT